MRGFQGIPTRPQKPRGKKTRARTKAAASASLCEGSTVTMTPVSAWPAPLTLNTWKTASSRVFQSTLPLTLLQPRKNSCCFRSCEAKGEHVSLRADDPRNPEGRAELPQGGDSATDPAALTPRMMCCGGILTTTRRVASSLGLQVLMPSMGDRSAGSERAVGFGAPTGTPEPPSDPCVTEKCKPQTEK